MSAVAPVAALAVAAAPVIGNINGAGGEEPESVPQMAKMPWYPRDFASSTRGWPLVARGAYRELLDVQWDMGSLPGTSADLRVVAMATPPEWRIAWKFLESKFPIGPDGRRRNARLENHRAKALQILKRQRAGAAATNAGRSGRQ